jgi:hypothetical protein
VDVVHAAVLAKLRANVVLFELGHLVD